MEFGVIEVVGAIVGVFFVLYGSAGKFDQPTKKEDDYEK
jgi:hypothetical protein